MFTVRTEDDEREVLRRTPADGISFEVMAFTALVSVEPNPRSLAPEAWVRAEQGSLGRLATATLSGRPAVRITSLVSSQSSGTAILVGRNGYMFIAYPSHYYTRWLPPGRNEAQLKSDLQVIVDSLQLTR